MSGESDSSTQTESRHKSYYNKMKDNPEWKAKKAEYNKRYTEQRKAILGETETTRKEKVELTDEQMREKKRLANKKFYDKYKNEDKFKETKSRYNKEYQERLKERKKSEREEIIASLNRLKYLESLVIANGINSEGIIAQ